MLYSKKKIKLGGNEMKKISFLLVFILVVSIVTETNSDGANVNNTNTAVNESSSYTSFLRSYGRPLEQIASYVN